MNKNEEVRTLRFIDIHIVTQQENAEEELRCAIRSAGYDISDYAEEEDETPLTE